MRPGIVICARLASSRLPQKAIMPLGGEPLIRHLVRRVLPTKLPIVLAVPPGEEEAFRNALGNFSNQVYILQGSPDCPLTRMYEAAAWGEFDYVVRICTDKIFVDHDEIRRFVEIAGKSNYDYLYSSSLCPGAGFEVIDTGILEQAAERFENVEHVSYAIRAVTDNIYDVPAKLVGKHHRLLIDRPEDVTVIEKVLAEKGNNCSLVGALNYLTFHPEVARVNKAPLVSVYTCAYNAEKYLDQCLRSVVTQDDVEFEHILVDDASTDRTGEIMRKWAAPGPEPEGEVWRYRRNETNLGLASSSNIAASLARGEYIVRLDADDYLVDEPHALANLVNAIERTSFDVVYPSYFYGDSNRVIHGSVQHHAGGAIFRTRALGFLRFTDGLRGFEGYDLWKRAQGKLRIGYLPEPIFCYRQHPTSLSKQDPEMRAKIKEDIDART